MTPDRSADAGIHIMEGADMSEYAFGKPIGKIIHGGDYNPEQWLDRPDILEKDIEYMKQAGVNEATLGVFSWAMYEPREGEFHLEWLHEIMDRLYENGIYTILATPSAARPAWLDSKYPEVMRVDDMGIRRRHGLRHNHCLSSGVYREKVSIINRKLAEEVGDHPGLLAWHISNEFGGECFCDLCKAKFQDFLRKRYNGDIEKLNHEWWATFWSARYSDFSEVEPPYANGQIAIMGHKLDWRRFTTWNYADYTRSEIRAIREGSKKKDVPITTNLMKRFYDIDYRVLAKELDVISWDSYPLMHNDWESYEDTMIEGAFDHAIMRGLRKDKPFLLMESCPGSVNWSEYNKLKRPKVHEQFSLQAVACGSDSVQYFQWRQSRGAWEQFHGAVVSHLGTNDTRIFREVAHTGETLKKIAEVEGSTSRSEAAIIFEWENWWAIDYSGGFSGKTKKYDTTCQKYWEALMKRGIDADIISVNDDFDGYKLILAPMLFSVKPETAEKLKAFVEKGGILLGTYMTGYVNENTLCYEGGFPGAGLKDLFGVIAEEIDTLYPSDKNAICMTGDKCFSVRDYCEILRVSDAEVLGKYKDDFYAGTPAITCKKNGQGKAYYQAARILPEELCGFLDMLISDAGIKTRELPSGIEWHRRIGKNATYDFYLNLSEQDVILSGLSGMDLVAGETIDGNVTIPGRGNLIVKTV